MTYTVKTWAGNDIETGNYQAFLNRGSENTGADVEMIQLLGGANRSGRGDLNPRDIELIIKIVGGSAIDGINGLKAIFAPATEDELVVDIDGTSWRIVGAVQDSDPYYQGSALLYRVTLECPDPFYELNAAENATASGSTSPVSQTVANQGTAPVGDAVFSIKPTANKAAADGRIYRTTVAVANITPRTLTRYPICLTDDGAGGGWDHAAEVTAGRSLDSGDDVKVYFDHVEVPRYVGNVNPSDWNDTDTKLWATGNWEPGRSTTIPAAITAGAPASGGDLDVVSTKGFPSIGALLVDDETLYYTGKTATSFTGITRGAWGTTAASHSADVAAWRQEHRIDIVYGWTGAPASEANAPDALKPIFNLASSDNQHWVYDAGFSDSANPKRPGSFAPIFSERDARADRIVINQGSPDTELEWFYQAGGALAGFPNFNIWGREFPSGTGNDGAMTPKMASFTYSLDDEAAVVLFGWDGGGKENAVKTLEGAAASVSDDVDEPAFPLYWLGWYLRSRVTNTLPNASLFTATTTALETSYFSTTGTTQPWQSFTAHGDGLITGVAIFAGNGSAGATEFRVQISLDDDDDGDPDVVMASTEATVSHSTASQTWLYAEFATPVPVQDGLTYYIEVRVDTTANSPVWTRWATLYKEGAASVAGYTFGFKVLSPDLDFQDGVDAIDNQGGAIEDFTVYLDDDTPGIPYVAQLAREDTYELDGVLDRSSPTPAQTIGITAILDVNDVLEVDAGERTVRNVTTGEELYHVADPGDTDTWIQLSHAGTGNNTIRWNETGLGTVQVDVDYRSKRG